MNYIDLLETLILTNDKSKKHSYLENEFPYVSAYEPLNLAILDAAKNNKKSISFDFVDNDMSTIRDKVLKEIEVNYRKIYPSNKQCIYARENTFNYPRYLAARGFNIEIKDSLKRHGYVSKSYFISW